MIWLKLPKTFIRMESKTFKQVYNFSNHWPLPGWWIGCWQIIHSFVNIPNNKSSTFPLTSQNNLTKRHGYCYHRYDSKGNFLYFIWRLTLHCCSVSMRFLFLALLPPPPCCCGCRLAALYANDWNTVSETNKIIWWLIRLVFIHFLQQLSMIVGLSSVEYLYLLVVSEVWWLGMRL